MYEDLGGIYDIRDVGGRIGGGNPSLSGDPLGGEPDVRAGRVDKPGEVPF